MKTRRKYYDANQVEEALRDNALKVCEYLLPHGRPKGGEWNVGGLDGEKGDSMSVCFSGPKIGAWSDFATGECGGTLLNLWRNVRGGDFLPVIEEAAKFVGVQPELQSSSVTARRVVRRPSFIEDWKDMEEGSVAWEMAKNRGLSPDTAALLKQTADGSACVFLHKSAEGSIDMVKYWGPKKKVWTQPDPIHGLFGKDLVPKDHDGEIVITEGQWDAMSYIEAGLNAVSIPSGCTNHKWVEIDWEWLRQFHTIYLSFDMDEPGREAHGEAVNRLGAERCRSVELHKKDANEVLLDPGGGVGSLVDAIEAALFIDPEELVVAEGMREDVRKGLLEDISTVGAPFVLEDMKIRFREHESTVWTGYAGDGKSTALRHLMATVVARGESVCLADLESMPRMTIGQMVRQICGDGDIATRPESFDKVYSMIGSNVVIYGNPVKATPDSLLDKFQYAYRRWGCKHFVLDNVMMLKVDRNDLDAQAHAAYQFKEFVKSNPVHLHVVAHPRKPPSGESPKPPTIHEVKGASEWCDMAYNVVAVWRNKKKSADIAAMTDQRAPFEDIEELKRTSPDGKIVVCKQRATGDLPMAGYWFDPSCQQLHPRAGYPSINYIN